MMNKPTIDEVLAGLASSREPDTEEPNRYTAVMVVAKRARQINNYYRSLGEGASFDGFLPPLITEPKNYISMALAEAAKGEIRWSLRQPGK